MFRDHCQPSQYRSCAAFAGSGYQPPGAACRPGGTGGEPTGISDTPSILGSPLGASGVREPFLRRHTDRKRPRYDLGGEGTAVALGHVTVKLIGIGMTEPDLNVRALPLVDPVVGPSPEGN